MHPSSKPEWAAAAARRKAGLETPLVGRRIGETALLFAPPAWYEALMAACLFGGPLLFVARWTGLPLPPVLAHAWLGWALLGAGIWALLSSERLVVNLRQKSWTRQEGSLAAVRVTKGPLDELDALVVTVRPNPSGGGVIYDLVLHWKLARRPPLPLERMPLRLPGGMPTQAGAGPLVAKAADYGAWMGLPVYDNTQAFSGSPVPWV